MDDKGIKFSLITCTYNPNPLIFNKLISSISNLILPNHIEAEWIVVDNNSDFSISESFDFSSITINIVHKLEIKPGLTNARIAGYNEAKGNWLIFFDDDNEPSSDYILNATHLIKNFSDVKCWGAGNITVKFETEGSNTWIEDFKSIFQERHINGEIIQEGKLWNDNYPQGTGQIIHKAFFDNYLVLVDKGIYSMSDRKGKSLSSGGDVQIALNVIKMGFKVGISELLALSHNIEKKKSTFKYLFKLIYGMASGAILSHEQVFPSTSNNYEVSNADVLTVLLGYIRQYKFNIMCKKNRLVLSQRLGNLNAKCVASQNSANKPINLRIIEKFLF